MQKSIFGTAIDAMHKSTPQSQRRLLHDIPSAFCFEDVYTRKGLDLRTRGILTFCIVNSLGGCESQVKSHVQGNVSMGNTKGNLIGALTCCLPYTGFPRTLNALGCVNAIVPEN